MTARKPARMLITIVMDLLIVLAIAETMRLVVRFFGQLASTGWAKTIVAFTDPVTIDFGVAAIKTPYGGVFDVNAAIMVAVLLLIEWALSSIRSRA